MRLSGAPAPRFLSLSARWLTLNSSNFRSTTASQLSSRSAAQPLTVALPLCLGTQPLSFFSTRPLSPNSSLSAPQALSSLVPQPLRLSAPLLYQGLGFGAQGLKAERHSAPQPLSPSAHQPISPSATRLLHCSVAQPFSPLAPQSFRQSAPQLPGCAVRRASSVAEEDDEEGSEWRMPGSGLANLEEVLMLVEEKKGQEVVVLDARELPPLRALCDRMVILTCTSQRHMRVVADHLVEHYKLKGMLLEFEDEHGNKEEEPPRIEGLQSDVWMAVDLRNIIVQVMTQEGRERYQIEEHWRNVAAGLSPQLDPDQQLR